MSEVTLRDVAEAAGVSVRTVSNVVNDYVHVAPQTRQRVQEAVRTLGYRPNLAARQLRRGRPVVVSVVVPELESPYFAEIASLLSRSAAARGWVVHVVQTGGDPEAERRMLEGVHGTGADAVVFSPWALGAQDVARGASAPPVVMLGERSGVGLVDHVAVDNVAAARQATAHLVESGRRRIAAVGLQSALSNETARQRLDGYRQALTAAGIESDPHLQVEVRHLHRHDGMVAARRLFAGPERPDGIFCFTDQLALGALSELAELGLRVPQDVAVVGFDDIEDGRFAVPSLTTVAPDKSELVELALDCVRTRLADPSLPARERVVGHRLAVRASTGGAREADLAGRPG